MDYFRTMQIPLLADRFSQQDTTENSQTVIIDQKFAQRFWPHNDAIGKHLWFDPKKPITMVGFVGVVKQYGLETDGKIALYLPLQQDPDRGMFLVVRSSLEDAGLSAAIAREIHAVDPNVVVYGFRTMQDRLYDSLARQRFSSTMLGAFAVFALLLASVGLYGVMSYLVTQSSYAISLLFAAALNCCRMGLRSLWAICSRSATDVSNQYHRCNCRCRGYRPSWRAGGGSIAGSFLRLGKWALTANRRL